MILLLAGVNLQGQAPQQTSSPERVQDLERRIQDLEQTVRELKELIQEPPSGTKPSPMTAVRPEPIPAPTPVADPTPDRSLRIHGYFFGDYYYHAKNHLPALEDQNGFRFRRLYLTFDKPLSETFDARVRFEMNSPGDFSPSSKVEPFLKDAYLRWRLSGQNGLLLGLSPSPLKETPEALWGYRSLNQTAAELQRFGSSRDLGVALRGSFDPDRRFRYHFMLGNGAGTSSEINQGKKVWMALGFHPTDSLLFQFTTDHESRPDNADRYTLQGLLGYETDTTRLGLQYAHQHRQGQPDLGLDVISFFGVLRLSNKVNLFGRYDRMFDPNPDGLKISYLPFDPNAESNFFLAGLDIRVSEQFNLMPNLQIIRYGEEAGGNRPGTDVVPRLTFWVRY